MAMINANSETFALDILRLRPRLNHAREEGPSSHHGDKAIDTFVNVREAVAEFHFSLKLNMEMSPGESIAKWKRAAKSAMQFLIEEAAIVALRKIRKETNFRGLGDVTIKRLSFEFGKSIEKQIGRFARAYAIAPQLRDVVENTEQEMKRVRKAIRAEFGRRLFHLKQLKDEERRLQLKIDKMINITDASNTIRVRPAKDWHSLTAPKPAVPVTKYGDGLPRESGIYFVWSRASIVYVGQSIRLRDRCKIGHENIAEGEMLSWLLIDRKELDFAESYFIGVHMPPRNFGRSAAHIKYG